MKDYVQIDSLTKSINNRKILSGIHMIINKGEIIGLFGRNGSGKSTLMSILFGITRSDSIFLSYNGKIILNKNHFYKIFSHLPQFNFLPQNITVKTLIWLAVKKEYVRKFYDDTIIQESLDTKIHELSFGIQKYLQIKFVLFNSQRFCLLDEPYNGLSPLICEKINSLLVDQSKYKGILIADHNYSYILKVSSRNYILKDGNIFSVKNTSELIEYGYLK